MAAPSSCAVLLVLGASLCSLPTSAQPVTDPTAAAASAPIYRTVTRTYHTHSVYLKGLQTAEVLADAAGRPYLSREQTYVLRDEVSGAEPADGSSASAVLFPQLVKTEQRQHEGSTSGAKLRVTTHAYDRYGNVTRFGDSGDDARAADDVSAAIAYSAEQPACPANGITGTALAITVSDRANQTLRRRDAEIDCTNGDIRQVRQYLAGGAAATTDLAYDAYGNLARVTGPANARGQRYELAYAYDAEVATHVREVRNSFGYTSRTSHDLRFGQATETKDLNAQRVTTALDAFGRVASITSPGDGAGRHADPHRLRPGPRPRRRPPAAHRQHRRARQHQDHLARRQGLGHRGARARRCTARGSAAARRLLPLRPAGPDHRGDRRDAGSCAPPSGCG